MIYGSFRSNKEVKYTVYIDCSLDYEIGSDKMINFTDEPVTIEQDVDDTFEHIIKTTCTINLLTNTYLGDYLFSDNDREISVMVYKTTEDTNECIFSGYVEPLSFSQDFADEFTEIELNCIDWLSTLENHKYKETEDYDDAKANADSISFENLIKYCLNNNDETNHIWYDGLITTSKDGGYVLQDLGVSELLMFGDEEDDLWTCEEVLTEVLQYFNLHIIQRGNDFYIFSYETIKAKDTLDLVDIKDTSVTKQISLTDLTIDKTYYKDSDTNISMSDVYNRIEIECDLQETEDVFKSPFEDEDFTSPFNYKYRFLMEHQVPYEENKQYLWYFQFLMNKNWNFRYYYDGNVYDIWNIINENCIKSSDGTVTYGNQYKLLEKLENLPFSALLGNFSKVENQKYQSEDNSISNDIDTNPCIVIPVRGTYDANTKRIDLYNKVIEAYENAGGMIEYKSKASAGVLSPSDANTTNYIVFSGKFALQPKSPDEDDKSNATHWMPFFYTDEFYPEVPYTGYPTSKGYLLKPYLDYESWGEQFGEEYGTWLTYNPQSGVDTISKIGIFICELKIGDKYVCEPTENNFVWCTKEEAAAKGYETTFYLGCNPKVGDKLLCTEWEIPNTLTVDSNVDESGMAIPIKQSDNISGKVEFRILGLNNIGWDQEIRKHPTFFRHTKWWTTEIQSIMEFVDCVYLTDFECKICSDNGKISSVNDEEKDLIYMSNELNNSIQTKDDITFKFNTALTTSEALEKGISTSIKLSNVINISKSCAQPTIYNNVTGNQGKAEELYIDDYYKEYSKPKVIIETTLDANKTDYWNRFKFSYFSNKKFMTLSTEYNLKLDTKTFKIKEI